MIDHADQQTSRKGVLMHDNTNPYKEDGIDICPPFLTTYRRLVVDSCKLSCGREQ